MRAGRARGCSARRGSGRAVHDRHPAAQRDGQPPYRPRARQYAAGHPHPPRPHAGQGRALGGRHGPCRHRHPDGGRAATERAASRSAPISAATNSSPRSGNGRPRAAARSPASSAGSARAATGRTSASRWTRASAAPCSRSSSSSTIANCSIATSAWSTGIRASRPRSPISRSRPPRSHGQFWHFRYPLEDGSGAISVATTRPETMLADMAVAVHPEDARYAGTGRQECPPADHRAAGPDHHRRACRSRAGLGRGQDHAGP